MEAKVQSECVKSELEARMGASKCGCQGSGSCQENEVERRLSGKE